MVKRQEVLWVVQNIYCHHIHERTQYSGEGGEVKGILSLSLGAVSNSDVGGHGSPLLPVSCSFDGLDFTDF